MAILDAVFANKPGQTPQDVERRRRMAATLIESGSGGPPPSSGLELAGRLAMTLSGQYQGGKAERQDATNRSSANKALIDAVFGTNPPPSGAPAQPRAASPYAPQSVPQSSANASLMKPGNAMPAGNDLAPGIASTAQALGIDPVDLATVISYETAGTLDPLKRGPTTKWGQHRGLIQFGEPQAAQYGVNWDDPVNSQLGPDGAVAKYLRDTGVQPGMGLLDIYSAINAGGVGEDYYNRSDTAAGGAPGTVRDKVEQQMAGHRQRALSMFPQSQPNSLDTAAQASLNTRNVVENPRAMTPPEIQQGVQEYIPGFNSSPTAAQPFDAVMPRNGATQPASQDPRRAELQQMGVSLGSPQLANADPRQGILNALMAEGGATASPQGQFPQAPAQQQAPVQTAQSAPDNRAIIATLLGNPYTAEVGQQLLMQELGRRQEMADPRYQMEMERAQLELEQLRNPVGDPFTLSPGQQRYDAQGNVIAAGGPDEPEAPSNVREYEFYAQQEAASGRQPLSFNEWNLQTRQASATTVNNNMAETDKFYETLDADNAKVFSALSDEGMRGQAKLAQIDRLDGLLQQSPTGAEAAFKQVLGEYGIQTEGLTEIQAAQALINELVPQQRQPGSGPMSDADLALFKQSLPRIINQPGANQLIIGTMRGITQYQIQMGQIADAVANRDMSPKEGRAAIRALKNPLSGFNDRIGALGGGSQSGQQSGTGEAQRPNDVPQDLWDVMSPEDRALWQ